MISIVATLYNRRKQFIATLNSLSSSLVKDFEFIVVDDGSDDLEKVDDLSKEFPFLRVIRIEPSQKWYRNSCIPYNIGFAASRGDKIIIQNAECLHFSDIMSDVENTLDDSNYLSFGVYSVNREITNNISAENNWGRDGVIPFTHIGAVINGENCWYNHGVYRPSGLHFCNAITRSNLSILNGFDEDYAEGICYDDNEFLYRVFKLGLNIIFRDGHLAIHQHHENFNYNKADSGELEGRNYLLYFSKTFQNNDYSVNKSKIILP